VTIVVSDAGPLIGLARAELLVHLASLYETVLIPKAVYDELQVTSGRPGATTLGEAIAEGWLKVHRISRNPFPDHPYLGSGELEAIAAALELRSELLMDELRGRRFAAKQGVRVFGTGKVLLSAKQHGHLRSVGKALEALRQAGYRLSAPLCRRLLELAEEVEK
jgi:predicted nucleic acid-binding protein